MGTGSGESQRALFPNRQVRSCGEFLLSRTGIAAQVGDAGNGFKGGGGGGYQSAGASASRHGNQSTCVVLPCETSMAM